MSHPQQRGFDGFNQRVSAWVGQRSLPGAHHLVTEKGRNLNQQVIGYADIETGAALHDHSLFRLASASKIFLSVGFLRLVQQGLLALDDPVASVLPEYQHLRVIQPDGSIAAARCTITMEDLLRHTCGFGYGATDPYRQGLRSAGLLGVDERGTDHWIHRLTLRQWASALAAVPMGAEPGTAVSYGLGHDLLGAVIETVTGLDLDHAMARELFDPLDLNDTFFVVPEDRATDLTSFHDMKHDQLAVVEPARKSQFLKRPTSFSGGGGWDMLGNGGLVSSAGDVSRLLALILDGGALAQDQFLDQRLAARLTMSATTHLPGAEMLPGCGYSFGVACVENPAAYSGKGPAGTMWWGGSTNTCFFYVPTTGRLGVFLTHTFPFAHLNAIYRFANLAGG